MLPIMIFSLVLTCPITISNVRSTPSLPIGRDQRLPRNSHNDWTRNYVKYETPRSQPSEYWRKKLGLFYLEKHRLSQLEIFISDPMFIARSSLGKRALAMMARWAPFNNIGKEKHPIRSNFVTSDDYNSVHTRGRVNQPLRWG